jgi:hypothetical protein
MQVLVKAINLLLIAFYPIIKIDGFKFIMSVRKPSACRHLHYITQVLFLALEERRVYRLIKQKCCFSFAGAACSVPTYTRRLWSPCLFIRPLSITLAPLRTKINNIDSALFKFLYTWVTGLLSFSPLLNHSTLFFVTPFVQVR